jgi:NAD(P)H-hydrate epimerase
MEKDSDARAPQAEQLAKLLVATGQAHHEAFTASGGVDPDWAIWYADHTVDQVNDLLGSELSRADLVYEYIGLSREQLAKAPDASWPQYYASSLFDRFG